MDTLRLLGVLSEYGPWALLSGFALYVAHRLFLPLLALRSEAVKAAARVEIRNGLFRTEIILDAGPERQAVKAAPPPGVDDKRVINLREARNPRGDPPRRRRRR